MEKSKVKQKLDIEKKVLQRPDINRTKLSTIKTESEKSKKTQNNYEPEQNLLKSEHSDLGVVNTEKIEIEIEIVKSENIDRNIVKSEPNELDTPGSVQDCFGVEFSHAVVCKECGLTLWNRSELQQHDCPCNASRDVWNEAAYDVIATAHTNSDCELQDGILTYEPLLASATNMSGQNHHLNSHDNINSSEKPYKCTICNKSFDTKGNMKTHQRIHSGEKPYKCNTCNLSFTLGHHLKTHERTHSGEKPYKCKTCLKTFSDGSYLIKHQCIHSSEKPYKCNACDKKFSVGSYLVKHQRIHTGERPFKCNACDKSFKQSSDLKRHQRTHISAISNTATLEKT